MARRPYSTPCRFFSDSDQEVTIAWRPATEPVECLEAPSKINSLDWATFKYLARGVGEVYGADRGYNGLEALPYAHGLTPCGDLEVFRTGEVRDPDLPPQRYNEDGFPLCCLDRFTAAGGIEWSGAALVSVPLPVPPSTGCPPSSTLTFGVWYEALSDPSGFFGGAWFYDAIPGHTYRWRWQWLRGFTGLERVTAADVNIACVRITDFAVDNTGAGIDVTGVAGAAALWVEFLYLDFTDPTPPPFRFRIDDLG